MLCNEWPDSSRAVALYDVGLASTRRGGQGYPFSYDAGWLRATGDEKVGGIERGSALPPRSSGYTNRAAGLGSRASLYASVL